MKPHARLKLRAGVRLIEAPYWETILINKTQAITAIHPDIDALFAQYRLDFWVTQEYRPAHQVWGPAEIKHGLHRVYRIIFQEDK